MTLYDPVLYALVHQGNPGDVAFYRTECAGLSRVLELGCGYGRLSLPLAQACDQVWGVELHAGLLDIAHRRRAQLEPSVAQRVHLSLGDMRALALDGPFDAILIPFSGLYCLVSDEDVRRCLRSAHALLAPRGVLLFDGYAADGFHDECAPEDYADDNLEHVALIAKDGVAYDVYERSTWDRPQQRIVATYVHEPASDGAAIEHAITQRYLLSAQMRELLSSAGFIVEQMWGSFEKAPFDADSEFMIVRARRA